MKVLAPDGCNAFEQEPHLRNVPDSENAVGYTPEGWLNEYTLMCGYQEFYERDDIQIRMYSESGTYHVRSHNFGLGYRVFWECFEDLWEARKFFASSVKMMNFR